MCRREHGGTFAFSKRCLVFPSRKRCSFFARWHSSHIAKPLNCITHAALSTLLLKYLVVMRDVYFALIWFVSFLSCWFLFLSRFEITNIPLEICFLLFAKSVVYTHYIDIPFFLFSTVLRISISNLFLPCSRTWLYEPASATAQQPHFKHTNSRQSRFKWTLLHYFWFFVFRIFLVISSKRIIASQWPAVWFNRHSDWDANLCFVRVCCSVFGSLCILWTMKRVASSRLSLLSSTFVFGLHLLLLVPGLTFAHVILMRSRNMCTVRTRLDIAHLFYLICF